MSTEKAEMTTESAQKIYSEFFDFLRGTKNVNSESLIETTKISLSLIKTLPTTRVADFFYFNEIFINSASIYIDGIENEAKTGKVSIPSEIEETVISDIHSMLLSLISKHPTSWAPIVSTWSLEILGEISTRFAGRGHVNSGVLNDVLQLWMGCKSTRILIDITTKCLSNLMNSDTEACINALLDTSVQHSPNFDWVVAHVGSCFPNTVITRVLSCGLQDFCKNKSYEECCENPKLKSVVGILGHLASSHAADIRKAIVEIFLQSLEPCEDDDLEKSEKVLRKRATVPFILQLTLLSSKMLSSICCDLKTILTIETTSKCYPFFDVWCKYFGSGDALEELIVSLVLKCESGGIQIIKFLLDSILYTNNILYKEQIQEKCKELLQNILTNINDSIRQKNPAPIIHSLADDMELINDLLLKNNKLEYTIAGRIVIFSSHENPMILTKSLVHLLKKSTSNDHLSLLIQILTNELVNKSLLPYSERGGYLGSAIEQILGRNTPKFFNADNNNTDLCQMWSNILTLLRWEKSNKVPLLKCQLISKALYFNLEAIVEVFNTEKAYMHVISDIIDYLDIPSVSIPYTPNCLIILNLTQSIINYFFVCCRDEGTFFKIKGYQKCARILKRLCNFSKVARVLALRELLERALFKSDNVLFGAINTQKYSNEDCETILLKQNKKISKTIPLTKHSSVFNGGIIGGGKRKFIENEQLPKEVIAKNTSELITILQACCSLPNEEEKYCHLSLESVTLVSLLLVQFVSPDVMYNGLPWPEEEFSKVTVERDLMITRFFKTMPLLWDLLSFVAVYRPTLCYSSVLIRALTATLMHQWRSMGDQDKSNSSYHYDNLLDTSIKVIDIMALGQLLPPPLSNIRDVLPHLKSFEIVAILRDCVWCYMRDHVPSPALFNVDNNGVHWRDPTLARPSEMYTTSLRIILQRNIKSLGDVYSQMFINVPKNE